MVYRPLHQRRGMAAKHGVCLSGLSHSVGVCLSHPSVCLSCRVTFWALYVCFAVCVCLCVYGLDVCMCMWCMCVCGSYVCTCVSVCVCCLCPCVCVRVCVHVHSSLMGSINDLKVVQRQPP